MKEIYASKTNVLNIGFMGEDNRTRVHFPVGDLQAEFPGCSFVLLIKRAGDNGVYVVEPVISGDEALWTVEDGFLANKGEGEAVLICSTGTVTAKRKAWKTWTDYSLSGGVTPPADFSAWVTELLQAGADVQAAVDAFNEITAEATEGEQTSAYIDRTGDHPVLKITIRSGGGGGAVESVNNKTGVVVLSASDVHALPDSTSIPVVDSDLSGTSTNAIQNKVVKNALDQKADSTTVSQLSETIVDLKSAFEYFPDSAAFTQYVRSLFQLKTWYNGSFVNDTTRLSTTQPMSFPFDIKVNNPFYTVAVLKWSSKTPSSSSYIERVYYEDPSIVIKAGTLFTLTYSKTGNAEFAVTDAELVTVTSVLSNAVATNTANINNINSRLIEVIGIQWAQGGLAWDGVTERSDRIHAVNYLPNSVHKIKALDGYVFAFAGYNAENWLGYYSSAGTFGGASVWLTELDVDAVRRQYPYYTLKFVGAKTNLTDSLTPSDATNFIFYNEDVNTIIRNSLPSYDTQESFNLIQTPIWQSNFGTVAVPQGICCSGDYVYVGGQTQGGNDSAPSYILKLSKTGTVIASNTSDNFGHCSGIAVDSVRNVAYIAKWDSATNYSTLYKVDTSTLEQVAEINMANTLSDIVPNYEGFVSCAYNEKYDKLILAMRGTPHHFAVLNPDDLSVDRVFRYAEPASGFTLQGIMSINDMVYLSWCRGTIASDNVENFISAYDWNGCEIFTAPVPRNDELEGVAFDGVSFYFTYQEFHTTNLYAPVYKAAYKPSRVIKAEVSTTYVGNYN